MLLARSAPEDEADEIAMNPDIDTRRSAVGGKADVPATWPGSPLLARSGHSDSAYWLDEEVMGTRSALSSAAVYNCLLDTPIPPKGMNGALGFSPRRR